MPKMNESLRRSIPAFQPPLSRHPQITARIFANFEHRSIAKAVRIRRIGPKNPERAAVKSRHTVRRAKPEKASAVLHPAIHDGRRQSVTRCEPLKVEMIIHGSAHAGVRQPERKKQSQTAAHGRASLLPVL
jgi:hypothetical protein